LGFAVEDVRVVAPDTDVAPESGPTVGSRSTTLMGNAILMAAEVIKKSLLESASEILGIARKGLPQKIDASTIGRIQTGL